MDSSSKDRRDRNPNHVLHYDEAQYTVSYAHRRNSEEADYDKHEDFNRKRHPVSRSGNSAGRVKRVVSCKRKTHHLTVARRKQLGPGRGFDSANKENDMKCPQATQRETYFNEPSDVSTNVNSNYKTSGTGSEQSDYCTLTELRRDHSTMSDVLFGRNLRLKVALTLWRRNVGELLTYFLKIQDTGVIVDFLPIICKCIDEDSPRINIGCCVDLFPLVRKVLSTPYEEYLIVGFKWICSVLKNWWEELQTSGYNGSTQPLLDENFQVFNQQLWELWQQEPLLKLVTGQAEDMAKVVESYLFQLR
ncbi:PREDICTED: KATNB1-like protein 1 [Poecilia mexicana]|uniref:Katanin p80 subunit C-terminal domain-containing protein n=1 Tax=Poecilia mexicana TaxID=48701 RepID=A0A3B3YSM2_9TELE|nr:PREDICTED: KATNB1-like protein 1 [Poecilia mexicana]